MEDKKIKNYLASINKLINNSNPKYMTYISKEYMTYRKINPIISGAIESMISKAVSRNNASPYAIFLDQDGTISLESISNISKINNLSEFINKVQELSKVNIDFRDMSSEDLIIEGSEIAEELSKELENQEMTKEEIEKKEKTAIAKISILVAIGGTIGKVAQSLITKIKQIVSKKETKEKETIKSDISKSRLSFDEVCPRVEINERKVIEKMNTADLDKNIKTMSDTYGDGDPDGDDLDL